MCRWPSTLRFSISSLRKIVLGASQSNDVTRILRPSSRLTVQSNDVTRIFAAVLTFDSKRRALEKVLEKLGTFPRIEAEVLFTKNPRNVD